MRSKRRGFHTAALASSIVVLTLFVNGCAKQNEGLQSGPDSAPQRVIEGYRAPFDVMAVRGRFPDQVSDTACPNVPPPVVNLDMVSKYAETSDRSQVDEAREKAYEQAMEPIEAFSKQIIKMANQFVRSEPPASPIARCVMHWLAVWGKGNALGNASTPQGEMVRAWQLSILALGYLQVRNDQSLSANDVKVAQAWIRRMADQTRNHFDSKPDKLRSKTNNHRYWAGWSLMTAAIVLNDKSMFDWAAESYRIGIDQVTEDGFLPHELARQKRAIGYHVYAIEPLVMIAEAAAANGVDLYAYREGTLTRMIRQTLDGLKDPSFFQEKTGFTQDMNDAITASKLAWLVPYDARFAGDDLAYWRAQLGAFKSTKLGGNADILYGRIAPAM